MAATVFEKVLPKKAKRRAEFDLAAPDADRRQVRWFRLVAAALVIGAAAIAGWLVLESRSAEVDVWVARERLEAGSVIEASDVALQPVPAGATLNSVQASDPIVGRTVRVTVPAGSTLVSGHLFGADDVISDGSSATMSLNFGSGRITNGVERNDLVRIVAVQRDGGELVIFDQVPVLGVVESSQGLTMLTIELSVEDSDQMVAAVAGAESMWATVVGRR